MKNQIKKIKKADYRTNLNAILFVATSWLKECVSLILLLFRPLTLISFVFTVWIIWYSQTQTDKSRLILEIIASVSSGIVGGIITNNIVEYFGNTILIKKSVGAIRNLQLIKYKVTNISNRIGNLININNNRDFEEVDNLVQNVHKDIINSIGDWGDVNPTSEAITDYYEMVAQREIEIKTIAKEKKELEKQKNDLAEGETSEISKLSKDIEKKDTEINKLKKQLFDFNNKNIGIMSGSLISGTTGANYSPTGILGMTGPTGPMGPSINSNMNYPRACMNCNNIYTPSQYIPDSGYCENCRGDIGQR